MIFSHGKRVVNVEELALVMEIFFLPPFMK